MQKQVLVNRGGWINSLQALRALAFLGIFSSHAQLNSQFGAWGVSVFFALSGFLMVYKYFGSEIDTSIKECVAFSYKRIKKLYMLHIFMMVVAIPYEIYRTGIDFSYSAILTWLGRVTSNILLIQAWIPSFTYYGAFNGVSWFLSATALLYFCFPYILKFIQKYREEIAKL